MVGAVDDAQGVEPRKLTAKRSRRPFCWQCVEFTAESGLAGPGPKHRLDQDVRLSSGGACKIRVLAHQIASIGGRWTAPMSADPRRPEKLTSDTMRIRRASCAPHRWANLREALRPQHPSLRLDRLQTRRARDARAHCFFFFLIARSPIVHSTAVPGEQGRSQPRGNWPVGKKSKSVC